MTDSKIIRYENISMVYSDSQVISDINFEVKKGEFVTVIGSSGCGKTTLLKMANGLIIPTSGNVIVNGKNTRQTDLTSLRRSIGYCVQGSVLFPHMTVAKNIAYVPNLLNKRDRKKIDAAVDKWMNIVGLEFSMKERYPYQLSGGQQQRVGIARSLAVSPEILLMDEPFGSVDEITRGMLQDEIIRIHEQTGITILFVTHDINEAMRLGTKVLVMDRGCVKQYDSPDAVRKNPADEFVEKLLFRSVE